MAREVKHWARRPIEYAGVEYDRGQVILLQGARNDAALVRLGYVAEVEKGTELYECAECGAAFVGMSERSGHGRARHRDRALTPEAEDRAIDAEERMLEQVAPLYLDKTLASQRG